MSDDPYADEEAPPHPADPPQPLVDFVGAFTDPAAQQVFGDAAVRIQDYMVRRQIADDNTAAADRMVNNIDQFKSGLVNMAQADPAATTLGIDLVPGVIQGLTDTHPFLPDDQRGAVYEQLTTDTQREIARAGVMSMGERDETAARQMLDHPKIAGLFDDKDRSSLDGYIGAQADARSMDAAAVAQQRQVDQVRLRDHSATNYMGALLHPDSGELQFPAGWAQRVLKDPALGPGSTAVMLDIYGRLQKNGDVPVSDPFLMADFISMAAQGGGYSATDVLQHAGANLALDDALTLAPLGTPQPAGNRAEIQGLAATVKAYRDQVVTPENGPAGVAAFERFMNWAVPMFRDGGSFANPDAENSAMVWGSDQGARTFWNHFAPRLDDLVLSGRTPGMPRDYETLKEDTADRMPLHEIFGASPAGDQVIRAPRPFSPSPEFKKELDDERVSPGPVQGGNPEFDKTTGQPMYRNPEIKS